MAEATSDKHLKIGAKRVGLARNVNLKARWNVRKSRAAVIARAARRAVPRSAACLGPQARLPPSLGVPILREPTAAGRTRFGDLFDSHNSTNKKGAPSFGDA
jgi:hypothetical protein